MSLREKLNKIINADCKADKGLLIINLLEDMGMSLEGNGWLDDDPEAAENAWTRENIDLIESIMAE